MKQIVIELSDELYKEIASEDAVYYPDDGGVVWQAVKEGTVLPDNHGRLIDANDLMAKMVDFCVVYDEIMEIPTILEAKEQTK